jgi:DNA-binding transcriptional LysR family regulator
MVGDLNLNQLRIFYYTVRSGGITLASEALSISQPAVSMQIKALEAHYEVALFVRKKRKLQLTETGKRLYQVAEKIFGLVSEAEQVLVESAGCAKDVLRIGSTKTLVRYILAGHIAKFRKTFPTIQIQVDEGSSESMVQSVLDDRNDLAIVGRTAYDERLEVIPFIQDTLVLLAAPGHPLCKKDHVTVEDLVGENFILRERGSGTRRVIDKVFQTTGLVPLASLETGNVDFIKELVRNGQGITMLARMGVDRDLNRGHLAVLPIWEGEFKLDIDIVVRKRRKLSKADHTFLNVLMEEERTLGRRQEAWTV